MERIDVEVEMNKMKASTGRQSGGCVELPCNELSKRARQFKMRNPKPDGEDDFPDNDTFGLGRQKGARIRRYSFASRA